MNSAKMYKDRFRKWGIGKNVKSHEKEAVIRKRLQRSRAGKSTAFSIRSSQNLENKIKRYQKATKFFSQGQAPRLRAGTPPDLVCYTPLVSPLSTPAVLGIPERVAREIQCYVDGYFSSGLWRMANSEELVPTKITRNSFLRFRDFCLYAVNQFNFGEVKCAWRSLNLAVGQLEQIILEEDPDTLETLIRASHMDSFDQTVGPFSWNALMYQSALLEIKSSEKGRAESFCRLLQEFEQALGISNERCLHIRLELSKSYLYLNQPRKVAEIVGPVVRLASARQSTTAARAQLSDAYAYLAHAHYQLSEMDLAKQNIRQAIHIGVEDNGWQDSPALAGMSTLRLWLDTWGRVDEAAEVRRQMDEILNTKYERLAMEEQERCQRLQISSE